MFIAAAIGPTGVVPQLRLTGRELVDKGQGLCVGLRHGAGGELIEGCRERKTRKRWWECA